MLNPLTTTKAAWADGSGKLRCETKRDGDAITGRWEASLGDDHYRGTYRLVPEELASGKLLSLGGEGRWLPTAVGDFQSITNLIIAAAEGEGFIPRGHAEFYGKPPVVQRGVL